MMTSPIFDLHSDPTYNRLRAFQMVQKHGWTGAYELAKTKIEFQKEVVSTPSSLRADAALLMVMEDLLNEILLINPNNNEES